jgi:D-glycero-D-manno-heptose 1,7-bisphosphate phosphatase
MNSSSLSGRPAGPIRFLFGKPPAGGGRRAGILLDRDGVINHRIVNGYVTRWQEFRFIEGAECALRDLTRLRAPILVISNQSGVGRGVVSRSALEQITRRFEAALERRSAYIDGVYYCPHRPEEGCVCRKPKPGMLLQAARDWRIDLAASVMVGDSATDVEAARAAGCQSILLDPNLAAEQIQSTRPLDQPLLSRGVAELPVLIASLLARR